MAFRSLQHRRKCRQNSQNRCGRRGVLTNLALGILLLSVFWNLAAQTYDGQFSQRQVAVAEVMDADSEAFRESSENSVLPLHWAPIALTSYWGFCAHKQPFLKPLNRHRQDRANLPGWIMPLRI
jgi:hypothetical protein